MKIYAKQAIVGASNSGSIWYKISRDDLLRNILWKDNIWVKSLIEMYPLNSCLDLDSLEGSFATEDTLYLLISDYKTITINGEDVDPEEVPTYYDLEDIKTYINDKPTSDVIKKITDSDLKWSAINIDEFAKDLLDQYTLENIAKDAEEIGLISL